MTRRRRIRWERADWCRDVQSAVVGDVGVVVRPRRTLAHHEGDRTPAFAALVGYDGGTWFRMLGSERAAKRAGIRLARTLAGE